MKFLLLLALALAVAFVVWAAIHRGQADHRATRRDLHDHQRFLDQLLVTCSQHIQLNDPFATTVADDITRFKTSRAPAGRKATP